MLDLTTLVAYVAILFGFVFLPGPAVVLTLTRSASGGTRVGVATALGIAVGDLAHTAMAVFGLSAIILASTVLFTIVKWLGAGYLIYLGLRSILERQQPNGEIMAAVLEPRKAFRQAIVAEILNPKSAMFFLAFLPQFVQPANGLVALQLTVLGVVFVAFGFLATCAYAVIAGRTTAFLRRHPAVMRWQGKFVGAIYCTLGARLALLER